MGPTRRPPVSGPGWNERAAVALLVVVAGHLLAAEPAPAARPLTPDRLARFLAGHDLPALVAVCEGSPSEQARHGAQQLRRLIRAGQAQVYQRLLPGIPVALADPYFRLDFARAAHRASLDLFPSASCEPLSVSYRRALLPAHDEPIIDRRDRPDIAHFTGEIGGILHPPSTLYPGVAAPALAVPPDRCPHARPARSAQGRTGGQEGTPHERSRDTTATTPGTVIAPLTGSWYGTVAGNARVTCSPS